MTFISNYYTSQNTQKNPANQAYNFNDALGIDSEEKKGLTPGQVQGIGAGAGMIVDDVRGIRDLKNTNVNNLFAPINQYGDPGVYREEDNPFKKGKGAMSAGAGALKGAAVGSQIAPGVGTAIGALYGLGKGMFEGSINADKRAQFEKAQAAHKERFFDKKRNFQANQLQEDMDLANQLYDQRRKASAYYSAPNSIYG